MLPQLRFFSTTLRDVSSYTYSGVIASYVDGLFSDQGYALNTRDVLTMAIWFVLCSVIFVMAYKKRGMEAE
jgi:ABC-2 type transport system permease protein